MKRFLISLFALTLVVVLAPVSASGATYGLFDWAFNVNGTTFEHFGANVPPVFTGAFDWGTGLGEMTFHFNPGPRTFAAFFDHEIDLLLNGGLNEYGSTSGAPAAGQSWEIDEPGWACLDPLRGICGDIYGHVVSNPTALDNSNAIPFSFPEDVSLALAWSFVVPAGKAGELTLRLGTTAPASGFYLSLTDAGSGAAMFYSGELLVHDVGPGLPVEPSTMILTGAGLLGAAWKARRRKV